jgi:hypothetical protein
MTATHPSLRALALLLTLGLATPAHAAPPLVDYVVQDGDTCQTIARKIYGSSKHLKLLHANNQLGPLPHKLKPGTILKVPATAEPTNLSTTTPPTPEPTTPPTTAPTPPPTPTAPDAILTFLRNEVDAYTPAQHPGQRDEPLSRGHRVNTHAASSAEITFADTSTIQLGEESLIVILGNTRTQARSTGKPEDTTLVTGSLRAHLGSLAGKPRPLALATPSADVSLDPGESQISVDPEQATRLAVHRGTARLRARSKTVAVPEQHGSKAARGKPPTPPRPLPAAPTWTTPPPRFVLQADPAPISGVYAPGLGLPGAPLPATWHVQVARDDRFNDLVVDTRAPAEVTRLELRVPAGSYHTRVSAIDSDQFEGRPGEPAPVTIASVQTVPATATEPARLIITPGTHCALGDAPLQLVQAPLVLPPGRPYTLRCAADATGAGATTLELPRSIAGTPQLIATTDPPQRIGDDAVTLVRITLRDAAGTPLTTLALQTTADPGVELGPLTPGDEPGSFTVRARWSPSAAPLAIHFTSADEPIARIELPLLRRTPPPVAHAPRLGPLGQAGVGLLVATLPLTAIGLGLTLSDLRPYQDDPLRRLDLRPAGITTLAFAPVLLISGATLLVLDQRRPRRLRVAPQATPTSAGLLLHGRF